MRVHLTLVILTIAASVSAQPLTSADWQCGTSAETTAAVARLHTWNRSAHAVRSLDARSGVKVTDGMFVVPVSSATTPLDHPNDLLGHSVHLLPDGPDSFLATTGAIQYDAAIGTMVMSGKTPAAAADSYVRYDLKSPLPLFGKSVNTIYVSALNGITLDPPKISSSRQLDPLQALLREATIAPLLMTSVRPPDLSWPAVWIAETSGGVTVTWRTSPSFNRSYDVQAKIASSGEIVFSYKVLNHVDWGSVVVTPGSVAMAGGMTVIAAAADDADDVATGVPAAVAGALDLRSLTIRQVSGSTLLQIDIGVGSSPLTVPIAMNDAIAFTIRVAGVPAIEIDIDAAHAVTVSLGPVSEPNAVAFNGNTISVLALNETLGLTPAPTDVVVESSLRSRPAPVDVLSTEAALPTAVSPVVDFAAANGTRVPIVVVEAFTLPVVDLEEVWEEVRSAAHLRDDAVDAIAIWQDFDADQVISNSAFAAGGNAGNDGVGLWSGYGRDFPRSPTLLNVSNIEQADAGGLTNASRVLMHEFGHRWLFFLNMLVNGAPSRVLDPRSWHPAQYVNTPAAFPLVTSTDASVMGGGYFLDNGNGTFTSAATSPYGFSWLDLYLIGLARAEEVPPSFYIDKAQPPLGLDYWPGSYVTVSGARRDFGVADVMAAMGPRDPACPLAQRTFTVYLVLLARDSGAVARHVDAMRRIQSVFETNFATATGGRGVVVTSYEPAAPRRRAVPK